MKYHLSFSVNLYNHEGESCEDCVLLHLNNGTIISFENMESYNDFIEQMQSLKSEIKEVIAESD